MTNSTQILSVIKDKKKTEMGLWDLGNPSYLSSNKERKITQDWLMRKIEEDDFNFGYFITLSFYKQTKKTINSYLDNEHIKNVILDYFYPHTKPHNRIRLWFFVEQHESGCLHTHFLMEKIDGLNWLSGRNRKMTLNKTTLFNIISNNYCLDEVIIEALTIHIKKWVRKLGLGKKSTRCVYLGQKGNDEFKGMNEVEYKVHYCQKSLDKNDLSEIDFDGWEHIDFENSDFKKDNTTSKEKTNEGNKSFQVR